VIKMGEASSVVRVMDGLAEHDRGGLRFTASRTSYSCRLSASA
jgi:hypothetical protein